MTVAGDGADRTSRTRKVAESGIGTPVACGQVLEKEHGEVLPQQRVVVYKVLQRTPLRRQFLLDAADEDAGAGHA